MLGKNEQFCFSYTAVIPCEGNIRRMSAFVLCMLVLTLMLYAANYVDLRTHEPITCETGSYVLLFPKELCLETFHVISSHLMETLQTLFTSISVFFESLCFLRASAQSIVFDVHALS